MSRLNEIQKRLDDVTPNDENSDVAYLMQQLTDLTIRNRRLNNALIRVCRTSKVWREGYMMQHYLQTQYSVEGHKEAIKIARAALEKEGEIDENSRTLRWSGISQVRP